MFCIHCGSRVLAGANFCTSCGDRMSAADNQLTPSASVDPRQPTSAPVPLQRGQSLVAQPPSEYPGTPPASAQQKCPWCGTAVQAISGASENCPRCGAVLQVQKTASISGWLELPPRRDMAKLQFGNSSCQIEGLYVPVADMNLAAEDSVYFSHHVLLWMDPKVNISTMSMKGGWKRMFAGMPLIMTQAQGPGHIAFSKDEPGEVIALPLQPGQAVDVREHMFLAATSSVEYDWFQTQVWYTVRNNNDSETIYPVGALMDRFSSPSRPGLLLLHAGGSVLVRQLAQGETILVKPTALIFKDPSVQMHMHIEHPNTGMSSWGYRTNRSIWLRLFGPGRVAIQSAFERMEQEGGNMVSHSYATIQEW